jgi:hypothetical protein
MQRILLFIFRKPNRDVPRSREIQQAIQTLPVSRKYPGEAISKQTPQ